MVAQKHLGATVTAIPISCEVSVSAPSRAKRHGTVARVDIAITSVDVIHVESHGTFIAKKIKFADLLL